MRHRKPRFGVILLPYSVSFSRIREAARRAEKLGFDSLWVADHVQRQGTPMLECWATISALAASTERIRVGSLATCNSFRNPALLAKMVATVSEVSAGRVDLGIGLGYDKAEHLGYGFPFPPIEERVERLSESLEVITRLWREEKVSLQGRFTSLVDGVCLPRPAKEPRIWVAGRSGRVLEAAARHHVYGMNIVPYSGTMDKRRISSRKEIEEIAQRIESAGLHRSMYCGDGGAIIAENQAALRRGFARAGRQMGLPAADVEKRAENLSAVYGTTSQCREKIGQLADAGFEEMMLIFPGWQSGDYRNMDLFGKEFIG
jgi:alkanesulfonate monooxygenase SsuD/methylene tetrahydromethanopterin reductase-like flavin-dependent oxidoreductase (luciferase family)